MVDRSRSLIIGINGQDGIYLSQILHSFGHFVVGVGTSSKINKYVSSGVSYFQCDVLLGWQNTKTFGEVFRNMVRHDLHLLGK